jgi:hypothetical protein
VIDCVPKNKKGLAKQSMNSIDKEPLLPRSLYWE